MVLSLRKRLGSTENAGKHHREKGLFLGDFGQQIQRRCIGIRRNWQRFRIVQARLGAARAPRIQQQGVSKWANDKHNRRNRRGPRFASCRNKGEVYSVTRKRSSDPNERGGGD